MLVLKNLFHRNFDVFQQQKFSAIFINQFDGTTSTQNIEENIQIFWRIFCFRMDLNHLVGSFFNSILLHKKGVFGAFTVDKFQFCDKYSTNWHLW